MKRSMSCTRFSVQGQTFREHQGGGGGGGGGGEREAGSNANCQDPPISGGARINDEIIFNASNMEY